MNQNKVILLTGGNSRLGKVIVQYLAEKGHTIYCTSRKNQTSEIQNVYFIKLDVTSDRDIKKGIAVVFSKEKRIDVVINNAAVTLIGPALDFSAEDFKALLDTNVVGAFRVILATLSFPRKPQLIINITSLNGFLAMPNFGLYSASKFAMEALGQSLRYELAPSVRVVNVAPGALRAESEKKMPHKPAREKIPLLNLLLPLTSLQSVAHTVERLITAKNVPSRVFVGRDALLIHLLQKLLPGFLFEKIIFMIWKKR